MGMYLEGGSLSAVSRFRGTGRSQRWDGLKRLWFSRRSRQSAAMGRATSLTGIALAIATGRSPEQPQREQALRHNVNIIDLSPERAAGVQH